MTFNVLMVVDPLMGVMDTFVAHITSLLGPFDCIATLFNVRNMMSAPWAMADAMVLAVLHFVFHIFDFVFNS